MELKVQETSKSMAVIILEGVPSEYRVTLPLFSSVLLPLLDFSPRSCIRRISLTAPRRQKAVIRCETSSCEIQKKRLSEKPLLLRAKGFLFQKIQVVEFSPLLQFSSVAQVCPTLWPHELQHVSSPCPSPTPGVHPNSCPSSQWCHSAISSSVVPSPPALNPSQR